MSSRTMTIVQPLPWLLQAGIAGHMGTAEIFKGSHVLEQRFVQGVKIGTEEEIVH